MLIYTEKNYYFFVDVDFGIEFPRRLGRALGFTIDESRDDIVITATRMRLGAMVGIVGLAAGHSTATAQPQAPPNFQPGIAYNSLTGVLWEGGDSPYGIYYPTTPSSPYSFSFWTFRDTFLTPGNEAIGPRTITGGAASPVVGNTIAIVQNSTSSFNPTYYFGAGSPSGPPQPFFPCLYSGYKYWPNKAFFINSYLYVVLSVVSIAGGDTIYATDIARITNPTDVPTQWSIDYYSLVPNISSVPIPGTSSPVQYEISISSPGPSTTQANLMWFGNEALTNFYVDASDSASTYAGLLKPYSGNSVLIHGYYTPSGTDGRLNTASGGGTIAILIPYASLLAPSGTNQNLFNDPNVMRLANSSGTPKWTSGLLANDYFDISIGNPADGTGSVGGYSVRYNQNLLHWQLVGVMGNGGVARYNPTGTANYPSGPTIWAGTSALGPFNLPASLPAPAGQTSYTFPQLVPNNPIITYLANLPPPVPSDAVNYLTCYGVREWQLYPPGSGIESDSSVYFTYTLDVFYPTLPIAIYILEQDNYLYQNYFAGAPNPLYINNGTYFSVKPSLKTMQPPRRGRAPKLLVMPPKSSSARLKVKGS